MASKDDVQLPLEDDEEDVIREMIISRNLKKHLILDEEKEPELPKLPQVEPVVTAPKARKSKVGLGGLRFVPKSRDKLVLYPHDEDKDKDQDGDAEMEGGLSLVNY